MTSPWFFKRWWEGSSAETSPAYKSCISSPYSLLSSLRKMTSWKTALEYRCLHCKVWNVEKRKGASRMPWGSPTMQVERSDTVPRLSPIRICLWGSPGSSLSGQAPQAGLSSLSFRSTGCKVVIAIIKWKEQNPPESYNASPGEAAWQSLPHSRDTSGPVCPLSSSSFETYADRNAHATSLHRPHVLPRACCILWKNNLMHFKMAGYSISYPEKLNRIIWTLIPLPSWLSAGLVSLVLLKVFSG